jgi:predicted RNA-binding protein with PIN domain
MGTFNIISRQNKKENIKKQEDLETLSRNKLVEDLVYYMKSPELPVGPVGKIRLLGGAAPLSS